MAGTAPAAAARRRTNNIGNTKESKVITVAEDPIGFLNQSTTSSRFAKTCGLPPQNAPPAAVLGHLSERTLNKLHAFKFTSNGSCVAPPPKVLDHRLDGNELACEELPYLKSDILGVSDEDAYDEFEFDETIFDQTKFDETILDETVFGETTFDDTILDEAVFDESIFDETIFDETIFDEPIFDNISTNEDASCQTPDSSMLGVNKGTIDLYPGELEQVRTTDPEVPLQSQSSPQQFRTPPNSIETASVPMSPFLRPSIPQLAPSQSIIPSLIPHRRIPTTFRIAEVHRLLATLSPGAPPQRIELYATVAYSHRDLHTKTQEFTFGDLFFPYRPPYLCGTYTAWKLCELYNDDSAPFLGTAAGGKLCRAIVQVTKNSCNESAMLGGPGPLPVPSVDQGGRREVDAFDVEVLNIWEATWEDVEYVKGIVGA